MFKPTPHAMGSQELSSMSLHDVDPNTTNRIDPKPQAPDQNPTRSSDGTTAITNKQDGSSGAYVSTKDATVKVNDGTVNRVSLGLLADGSYGLKVSQEGIDVLTAGDDELVFNSGQNVLKIVDKNTVTLTRTAGDFTELVAYTHSLGYVPAVFAFIELGPTAHTPIPYILVDGTTGIINNIVKVSDVDNTQVLFSATAPSAGTSFGTTTTYVITFYLLQETAN